MRRPRPRSVDVGAANGARIRKGPAMGRYRRPAASDRGAWASKRYKAPAPMGPFRYKVKGGARVVATYDELHRAWRAGVIADFYYGTRSDTDPSLVWHVGALELEGADLAGVALELEAAYKAAGVTGISWGETWCGYRALVVTFATGVRVEQCYRDGAVQELVTGLERTRAAVAA